MDHMGQILRIIPYCRDVRHSADIDSAVTHEYANPRFLSGHILFGGHFLYAGKRPPGIGKVTGCGCRRGGSLHYSMRYILWLLKSSANENAFPVGAYRRKAACSGKSVVVKFHPHLFSKPRNIFTRRKPHGKDNHVKPLLCSFS